MNMMSLRTNRELRTVAAFDFDGTLTTKDSLLEFLIFTQGTTKTYFGLLVLSPFILLMFLHVIDNNRCKEILLSYFFKGMEYERFRELGQQFAHYFLEEAKGLSPSTVAALRQHLDEGHKVYIISASVDEWVRPIAQSLGVTDVLCTHLAVGVDGMLTGKYDGNNCHGQEKVNRLLAAEPQRDTYYLYAYGDSSGDHQLFALADEYQKIEH